MAKAAVRHRDDDDDGDDKLPARTSARGAAKTEDKPLVAPAGYVVGPVEDPGDVLVVQPMLASDVAPGFTAGAIPGSDKLSKINVDTPTYGTETPPRQTPPTSIGGAANDQALKHPPPSAHDANGAKIVSVAPTCSGIAPTTGTAGSATPLVVTLTGTNFDRATYAAVDGVVQSQSAYVSATSMTVSLDLRGRPAGTYQITAVNSAGASVQRALTLS